MSGCGADIEAGRPVLLVRLPAGCRTLPEETQRAFDACLGRSFVVDHIDANGLLVLDVSNVVDPLLGSYGNDLRVEASCVSAPPTATEGEPS